MHLALLALLVASGPLGLRIQGTLRELFLDVILLDARPLERPEIDVRYALANDWNEAMLLRRGEDHADQLLDEQADSITLRYRAPLPWTHRVQVAVEGRLTEHWGGFSDATIETWHALTGAFNYQRDQFPRNRIDLRYHDDGGTAFDVHSPRLAVGDLALRTQATVWQHPRGAVALRLDLKAPTGLLSRLGGSGGFDEGLGLSGTALLWPWATVHAMVSVSHFGALSAPTLLQPKPWHFLFDASLELRLGENATLLVEDRCGSPLLQPGWSRVPAGGDDALLSSGLYAGFRPHNQISAGLRAGRFSFWMSEDFTPGPNPHSLLRWIWVSNAPDIVVGAAFTAAL